MKPSDYFNSLETEKQRNLYPTMFGSTLFNMYQNIDRYVEEMKATRLVLHRDRYYIYKRGEVVFKALPEDFEPTLLKFPAELHEKIRRGAASGILSFFKVIPLIIDTDDHVKQYMRIVERSEDRIEIEVFPID
jgi:hypothetical protein